MSFWNKPQTWLIVGVAFLGLLLVQQFWHWEVERVEVPSDHFLVRIHLWGDDLSEDEIISPDENHKGVMEEVFKEGRYFLNPLIWDHQIHKATLVPPGRFLVLTRRFGHPIPPDRVVRGEILANAGERGIVPEIKGPGKYYINPHAYDISEHEAVQIRAGQVGVRTLLWGKDPRELKRDAGKDVYVVKEDYRGVQEKPLQPETYYPNPYVERIAPIDTRTHEVLFTDIDFPSPDGFHMNPHIKVVYRVLPEKAPLLFVTLSNDGVLHQGDATEKEKNENEILQKVILPLIKGFVRIEGSKYDARDFITQKADPAGGAAVNPLEKLQQELTKKVTPPCEKLGIVIESLSIGRMDPKKELLELAQQISQREQTRLAREKNQELIEQYKQDQKLRAAEALQKQNEDVVKAKTRLNVQETKANQMKEVEEAKLKVELKAAEIRLQAARDRAKAILNKGKNEADVITAQNESEVAGLRTAIQGFPTPDHFASNQIIRRMAPALREIFASDTSDFAKLFSSFLTPRTIMPSVSAPKDKEPSVARSPDSK
jgi:regulator of protease activity HflC (stomatin/prohibitin superfamily)